MLRMHVLVIDINIRARSDIAIYCMLCMYGRKIESSSSYTELRIGIWLL